ncbi:MAG: hypothetical protein IJX51_02410 [Clostridia bacterium]|nr:hypothetical protein [Clostridia bacterium]
MKFKVVILYLLLIIFTFSLISCSLDTTKTTVGCNIEKIVPETNNELFDLILNSIENKSFDNLYSYTSEEICGILSKEAFMDIFEDISRISGNLKSITDKSSKTDGDVESYFALFHFENIDLEFHVKIKDIKIYTINYNIYFTRTFEIEYTDNVIERYFILENDGYKLNAVYTYINDGNEHPAILLIPGSGQCDYNETIGVHKPFEDIALGLAKEGICSLRIDKRTLNYASSFKLTDGLDEEYISDFNKAIDYLRDNNKADIYLLGHSLGGQIAVEFSTINSDIQGIVLLNSSARHLADIMTDQYICADPQNSDIYIQYSNIIKEMNTLTAKGYYYYGATDYYWASYNTLNTLDGIRDFDRSILIINSTFDKQSFSSDIELWKNSLIEQDNVNIQIYNDISHYGYKIDTSNIISLYTKSEFPEEIIDNISVFCKGK